MNFLIIARCVFILFGIISVGTTDAVQLDQLQLKCQEECGQSLLTQTEDIFDVQCNDTCRVLQCGVGCQQWQEAIEKDNCRSICSKQNDSKVIPIQNLYCVVGCRLASGLYVQTVKEEVGQPLAPVLVADSQSNVSVRILWDASSVSAIPLPVTYMVQWKYESLPSGWEYYRRGVGLTANNIQLVEDLKPYTKYRFRVAWLILPQHEPIFSLESVVITTLPFGVPSSSPVISSVIHIDESHVSISWDPPPFPNGPIASYAVHLKQIPNGLTIIKDIPEPSGYSFMFNNLKPNCNYTLAVSCRNGVGEGPKDIRNITTTATPLTNADHTEPYLVLGAKQKVFQQSLEIFDLKEPKVLYKPFNSSIFIRGVSIHVAKKLVFVSDSSGRLLRVSSGVVSMVDDITPKSLKSRLSGLSVDWLHNLLYVVEGRQISRLNLNGSNYQVVVTGFNTPPTDLKVDPYNGYLYWIAYGQPNGGLYQIDLGKIIKGQTLNPGDATLVIFDNRLSSFAIDYRYFRLFFPNETLNTMCSSSFSGSEVMDIRNNTQQPIFQGIKSLTYHKDVFYWTNGEEVIAEEYFPAKNRYYHNSFVDLSAEKPFVALNLLHPDAQPVPVPVNPVRNLQMVLLDTVARLSWLPPKPLAGLGNGAWQSWNYEIEVHDSSNRSIGYRLSDQSSGTVEYTLRNLSRSTNYTVQVRATSDGGNGPWSLPFHGKTLATSNEKFPHVLWSTSAGLLRSDLIGDHVKALIDISTLTEEKINIVDVAWYKDLVFVNTNNSEIYSLNTSQLGSLKRLKDISSAHSLAVDWLGKKLYWSCPKQQTISRCNFDGSQVEPLLIMTIAKELNVDSVNGFIYWTTTHSVECSRLNGGDRKLYFQTGFFSGKNVMGLALDVVGSRVYWIVWGFDGAKLYQAPTASYRPFPYINGVTLNLPVEFGQLQEENMRGPLRYFSDRLFWMHNTSVALVGDTDGNNIARLKISSPSPITLMTMSVVDESLQQSPKNVNVIPDAVEWSSVKILGQWNNFNVNWLPVTNVNYGTVFYEVGFDDQNITNGMITEYPHYVNPYMASIPPYTEVTVAVRAFTYWATSKRIIKTLRTPMSTPSEPLNLRAFVIATDPDVLVEVRWDKPARANGVISGYIVTTWATDQDSQVLPYPLTEEIVEDGLNHRVKLFSVNRTYFVQVTGFTEIGAGDISKMVRITTDSVSDVPKLLVIKNDSVYALDFDNHSETLLTRDIYRPTDVAYHWSTNRVYWLDHTGSLMTSHFNSSDRHKLVQLENGGGTPCVRLDWLSYRIYWTSFNSISMMDLTANRKQEVIVSSDKSIGTMVVDPFSSSLLWTEMEWDGKGRIMVSDTKGNDVKPLFRRRLVPAIENNVRMRTKRSYCDCPSEFRVGNALSVTFNEIFFIDSQQNAIWATDLEGCNCRIVFKSPTDHFKGLSYATLTSDKQHVYWSDSTTGLIYSVPRWPLDTSHSPKAVQYMVTGGMTSFGQHLQPLPALSCLQPKLSHEQMQLVDATSTTLIIRADQLESMEVDVMCGRVSKPTSRYVISYIEVDDGLADDGSGVTEDEQPPSAVQMTTYNTTVVLERLQAYTKYKVRVKLTNAYLNGQLEGAEATFQTQEGAPWKPSNVRVEVLSPERAVVSWKRPMVIRGPDVKYVVHTAGRTHRHSYSSVDSYSMNHQDREYHYVISSLQPSHNYTVTVEACGVTCNVSNTSDSVHISTFALPANLTFLNSTATHILIGWTAPTINKVIRRHKIAYKELGGSEIVSQAWQMTKTTEKYIFNVSNLLPNTRYVFYLFAEYFTANMTSEMYMYPKDNRYSFSTKGDRPGRPGQPDARTIGRDHYLVSWKSSTPNGGQLLLYILEAKLNDIETNDSQWLVVYNDTVNEFSVSANLDAQRNYNFRAFAINEFGYSDYSDESRIIRLDQLPGLEESLSLNIVLASVIPVVAIFLFCLLCVMYNTYRRNEKRNKKLNLRGPDFELATLRDMPLQRQNFVHQNNALYAFSDALSDCELSGVPRISRSQIDLIKLLGSGAFGDVFKGLAKNLFNDNQVIPVAIKTMKKGTTDQEKSEFLKEAQLMNNFKHDHILRLLGICLDNDPNFLILELMEGGDLLSYLRGNRSTTLTPSPLSIQDLISICVDVAKGCCYLEELHFVHRDLAARNCLVSSHNPVERVVKIGDFGLARDVYKNDYYRKEGEGLLPVRWMSPESLVDGVFTSHSDVWAFGVLLWEVMTLGQQPYPARTNVEVLHFVRAGGRLDKPDNCPDDLHELMIQCWSYDKGCRPSFKYCLDQLQELRRKSAALLPLTIGAVHNQGYLESMGATKRVGVDNPAYSAEDGLFHLPSTELNERSGIGGSTNLAFNGTIRLPDEVMLFSGDVGRPADVEIEDKEGAANCGLSDVSLTELLDTELGFEPKHKYLELLYNTDKMCESENNYEVPLSKNGGAVSDRTASTRGYSHLINSWSDPAEGKNKVAKSVTDDMKRVKYIGVSQPLLWTPPSHVLNGGSRRRSYENVQEIRPSDEDLNLNKIRPSGARMELLKRNSSVSSESEATSGCSSGPTSPTRVSDLSTISTSSTSGIDIDCAVKGDDDNDDWS